MLEEKQFKLEFRPRVYKKRVERTTNLKPEKKN